MGISFQDVKTELLDKAGPAGRQEYENWRRRPGRAEVVTFVENFTHTHLLLLQSAEVRDVMSRSQPPLGEIEASEALSFIDDFTCPFALQHIFHAYIEEKKHVPTWQEFGSHLFGEATSQWVGPLRRFLTIDSAAVEHIRRKGWNCIRRAAQWRVGIFYLSAMRELELFARLREGGLPVRYHVLADVLLRVDFWAGTVLICVYFVNPKFKDRSHGRKRQTEDLFIGSTHEFSVKHISVARQGFGKFWLAPADAVTQIERALA